MKMWFKKEKKPEKVLNSEEYERLAKRLIDYDTRIIALELSEKTFRDKVLRKIQGKSAANPELSNEEVQNVGIRYFGGGR